jgi:pimeloyl-ACP methyl ester carboxylesterase
MDSSNTMKRSTPPDADTQSPKASTLIDGDGPTIVLLHSSLSSKGQWRELIARMRHSHRLIAIDLHGYGDTPMPRDAVFRISDEVRLVQSVLRAEADEGEPVHLVGHSFGAVVALHFAQQRVRPLRSLCLFEPIAFHLLPRGSAVRAELESLRCDVETSLHTGDLHGAAAAFIDYWQAPGAFASMPLARQLALAHSLDKLILEFKAVSNEALRLGAYGRIDAPTCLIAGLHSPRPARRMVAMLCDVMRRVRRHDVEAGHMAPVTHPWLVNPVIDQFVRHVDQGVTPRRRRAAAAATTHVPACA